MKSSMKRANNNERVEHELNTPETQEEQETCTLYDYLKEHPSVWISVISGMVVVIGFLFHGMIYGNECKYLQYWHLDEKLIHIQNENQIYELVLSSILFLGMLFVGFLVVESMERCYENKKVIFMVNKTYKNIRKEQHALKEQIEESKKECEKAENNILLQKEILTLESITMMYDKLLPKYENNMKEVQKIIRRKNWLHTLGMLFLALVSCMCILMIVAAMGSVGIRFGLVLFAILFVLSLFVIMYLVYGFGFYNGFKRRFSKLDIDKQCKASEETFERFVENDKKETDRKRHDKGLQHFFTKQMMQMVLGYVVLLLVVLISLISGNKQKEIKENTTFQIVDYADKSYAVLYRDDAYFYLEEAEIQGKEVYIYVDKQLRIATEELYSVNMEFDKVVQVAE